jgi:hypothetical protein
VVVVVVRRKKQNSQLQHRNLYPDIERGSAESTTKQRSWKAVSFREAGRRAWDAREICLVVGFGDEGRKKPSSGRRPAVRLLETAPTMERLLIPGCMWLW